MADWFSDTMPFEFASPLFLLGVALAAVIFAFFVKRKKPTYLYSDFRLLGKKRKGALLRGFIWVQVTALTLSLFGALARPAVTQDMVVPIRSRDFVCAVDFSNSMSDGFNRFGNGDPSYESKFNAGRDALFYFIQDRTSDRFGCVLFATRTYSIPLLPGNGHILENRALKDGLAKNKKTLLGSLYDVDTRVGTGILAAVSVFEKMSSSDVKILVLVSDLGSDPRDIDIPTALKRAKDAGVSRVYILAVEAYAPDLEKVQRAMLLGDDFIRMFDIRDTAALNEAYKEIEHLEAEVAGEKIVEQKRSIDEYFFLSAFISFVLLAVFGFTIWRKAF